MKNSAEYEDFLKYTAECDTRNRTAAAVKHPSDWLGFAVITAGPLALGIWFLTIPGGWLVTLWLSALIGPEIEKFITSR